MASTTNDQLVNAIRIPATTSPEAIGHTIQVLNLMADFNDNIGQPCVADILVEFSSVLQRVLNRRTRPQHGATGRSHGAVANTRPLWATFDTEPEALGRATVLLRGLGDFAVNLGLEETGQILFQFSAVSQYWVDHWPGQVYEELPLDDA